MLPRPLRRLLAGSRMVTTPAEPRRTTTGQWRALLLFALLVLSIPRLRSSLFALRSPSPPAPREVVKLKQLSVAEFLAARAAAAPPRLLAVADLHGDLANAERSLRLAGALGLDGHWGAGRSTLVQTGDCVDRGPRSIEVLQLMWRLQDEAEAAGGRVLLLLGNHEAWALSGTNDYAGRAELLRLGNGSEADGRRVWDSLFDARGGELGAVLAARHSAAALAGVGKCRTLFVHAGLSASFLSQLGDADGDRDVVERLNERLAQALAGAAAGGGTLPEVDPPLLSERGPLWYRGYALGSSEARVCAELTTVLAAANASAFGRPSATR